MTRSYLPTLGSSRRPARRLRFVRAARQTSYLVLLLGLLLPGPGRARACDLTLEMLLEGRAASDFQRRILEVSRSVAAAVPSVVAGRVRGARGQLRRALDQWMEFYIESYLLTPPREMEESEWRALLDSITGPLRRLRSLVDGGELSRAHDRIPFVQQHLAELAGELPARPAGLGPLTYTLESLVLLPPASSSSRAELSARVALLRLRFDAWRKQARPALQRVPAASRLDEQFRTLGLALEEERFADVDSALEVLREIPIMAQVSRAMWGLSPEEPGAEPEGRGAESEREPLATSGNGS